MKKFIKALIMLIFAVSIFLTVYFSEKIKTAVYNSLVLCGSNLIPSLLPMMFITFLLIDSGVLKWMPKKAVSIFIFILTCVSGYPSGAKIYGSLAHNGTLQRSIAEKLIPTSVCAGPAFIINFVGHGLLDSKSIGIFLYISIVLSNLIVFIYYGGLKISPKENNFKTDKNALVYAAKDSLDAVIGICGYVTIFSAVSEIIYCCFGDDVKKIFVYITEVTGAITNTNNIYLVCFLLSFGGMCVFTQIISLTQNLKINTLNYIKTRLICGIISLIFFKILFLIFPKYVYTYSNLDSPAVLSVNSGKAYLITLLLTLLTLLLSIKHSSSGNLLKDIDVI